MPAAPWPRLPKIEGEKPLKKKFKTYPIGFVHIDIAELAEYAQNGLPRASRFIRRPYCKAHSS